MADLTKTVSILFQGKDNVSKSLKSITGNIDKFSDQVESIADPFAKIAEGVLKLDAAIAALVVGGIAVAIDKFASFEDVMLKVKGVLGASDEEYAALTATTKELGATTKFTAKEAADGLQFLALAGLTTVDAIGALPAVLNLAQASALDLGDTADIVTNIMAGYGIQVGDLGKTNDVLTATFTNSNTNLQQLGQAFQYVGPVAKSLGFSLEETAATLGILGNAGFQAEKGGTALRNIMLALVAPAGNMGKLMKELGVDTSDLGVDFADSRNALNSLGVVIKDQEGNILPFTNILGQIKTGLEDIPDPADRTATLIEIFGKRGGPQLAALLEQGTSSIDGLEDKINSLGGITSRIAIEMESGIGGSLRAISSAFESITLEIGENAANSIKPGTEGVTALFRAIQGEIKADTFKPFFDILDSFGKDAGDTLGKIAENLPEAFKKIDFSGLIRSLGNVSDSFKGLFDGLDLDTPEGLAKAIQFSVDTLSSLANVTSGIVDSLRPIFETIVDGISSFNDMDEASQKSSGNILGAAKAISDFGLQTTAVIVLFGDAADKLSTPFEIAVNLITGAFNTALSIWNAAKLAVVEIADDLLAASNILSLGIFSEGIAADRKVLADWKKGLKTDLIDSTEKAINDLTGLGVSFDSLKDSAENSASGMKTAGDAAVDATEKIGLIPDSKNINVETTGAELSIAELLALEYAVDEVPENKDIALGATTDEKSLTDTIGSILTTINGEDLELELPVNATGVQEVKTEIQSIPTEKKIDVALGATTDEKSLTDTINDIITTIDGEDLELELPVNATGVQEVKTEIQSIPTEKKIDVLVKDSTSSKISQIKTSADSVQPSFEYSAKVSIANAEASAQKITAAFAAASASVVGTSSAVSSMFSSFSTATNLSWLERSRLLDLVEEQSGLEEDALRSQIELNDSQIAATNARTQTQEDGGSIITISSDGLEPALEMVMFEILKKVQIKVASEFGDAEAFLFGVL